jgi:hypothetical protein
MIEFNCFMASLSPQRETLKGAEVMTEIRRLWTSNLLKSCLYLIVFLGFSLIPVFITIAQTELATFWEWNSGDGNTTPGNATVAVVNSEVIKAASVSYADVNAAIARANPGDTVLIPAGSATWTERLEITKPIKLIGAGIGQTVITSGYHPTDTTRMKTNPDNYIIVYYPSNPSTTTDMPFRISGFTINGGKNSFGVFLYNPTVYVQKQIRVDHMRIYNLWPRSEATAPYGGRPFGIAGEFFGVMDNCIIGEVTGTAIPVNGVDATWGQPGGTFDYGTARMFYFEDNQFYGFDQFMVIGSEMSARFCIRHNDFDGTAMTYGAYPAFDAHGNQPNAHCATMGVEIYENTYKNNHGVTFLDQRGGKAVVYNNNVIMTAGSARTKVRDEYNDGEDPVNHPPTNTVGQPQHPSDSYYWGNTRNGVRYSDLDPYVSQSVDYSNVSDPYYYAPLAYKGIVPQENREFWHEKDSFDGSIGVGVGLLANRPITCIKGVAYWATDTKTLYKCTATNVWTEYYKSYAYPHPLRNSN